MAREEIHPNNARDEKEIFRDLEQICCLSGYVHAIAYFCWRDNLIRFKRNEINESDYDYQYSQERLLRTEISTLIGLMVKKDIDFTLPSPKKLQYYIDRSETLLHEMHMCLQKPWVTAIQMAARDPAKAMQLDPFNTAEGLREPIFYAGESAYNFQYEEFSALKYCNDAEWLSSHVGFTMEEACSVGKNIGNIQVEKLARVSASMRKLHPDQWTVLPGFIFNAQEVANLTKFSVQKVEQVLNAFSIDLERKNASFLTLSSFNETNAAPIIRISDKNYVLLQQYSLLEALYEAPFFWMTKDNSYSATASKNRGLFAEKFLADRFTRVFGSKYVFQNVNIYKGKDRISEVDILVMYGDRAIVVQAKSKRLTIEARKGNDFQLKDDFRKAIHDSYDQSIICSRALNDIECNFVTSSGKSISFSKRPTKIFPVCAVADHFPALSAQARQFLNAISTEIINYPIVTDLFFLDVMLEILDTPLQFLNFLSLRVRFDKKILVNQEYATLAYHLRHNLWLEEKYNIVNLGDDFTSSLDIAMSARRLGTPGARTPKGILTRFDGTRIGKLVSEFEVRAVPELVGLGMLFLQLGSESAKHLNAGIDRMVRLAAEDGRSHDLSVPSEVEKSGFTIHISDLFDDDAQERLLAHCKIRKYDTKSDTWYGLLLASRTGEIRAALSIEEVWKTDTVMESALQAWTKKPLVRIESLSEDFSRRKIGRNEICPCGSGKKYKKCCLVIQ